MNDVLATITAVLAGLGTAIGAYVASRKSTLADENRTLEQRVDDLEVEIGQERAWSTAMARWAHEATVAAAAQGIDLPDMPIRKVA